MTRTMIAIFLLCAITGVQTLDVCASCHVNATCDDKPDGSGKVCNCMYGFVGNGRTFCQDKDECQIGASKICGQHTICHNTYGSYYCTCLSGYTPSNDMGVFIPNDGTHCREVDCGQPSTEEDTVLLSKTGTTYGSVATFVCDEGFFWANGDNTSVCGADGLWTRTSMVCEEVDCGQPSTEEDTVLLSKTGTTYGSVATFVCDEGFFWANGDNTSVCGADGLWTRTSMVCEEVDCGPPPAPPHSHMLWNKSSRIGTEVLYQCQSGFHNVGEGNVSICTAAGVWEEPLVLCKETSCGSPPLRESTERVWNGDTAPGTTVLYFCKKGFFSKTGRYKSVCMENGQWTTPAVSCQEILCGDPPLPPHTRQVWSGSSTPGSTATYSCKIGFYHSEGNNVSLCKVDGHWTEPNISCKGNALLQNTVHAVVGLAFSFCCLRPNSNQSNGIISIPVEIQCGTPPSIPHSVMLWDKTSTVGSQVVYQCKSGYKSVGEGNISVCSASGEWDEASLLCQAKCGPVPFLANSEVVWHNRSVVIHRCVEGYHSWRGSSLSVCGISGVWEKATLKCIEIKPPIDHLYVFNENCVHWKAEKYEEDMEVYKVTYVGSRDYQRSFQDRRNKFLSSKAGQLELCLNLLPVTNYSISITAVSARFTAIITTNTSLPVPSAPVVHYKEFETAIPTLWLRRSANTLDPISLYQVFVLPVEKVMVFDCSSAGHQDLLNKSKSSSEYITAQILVKHIGSEMNFTVGDGFHYGGFYNAPLENGKNYYVILRAVTQWKTALKSSCILWAKVGGTSYALRVSLLSAVASVGLVALAIWGGYNCIWFFKRT
ncbi:sushi domain-containing protein 1 isoform X2 [Echeneis naucrates]|uniref:sushi domain-containing protein 1 isoform X2 n=1 Tax=Echeneis naucrates TaxID=173247 RepID=UPI00111413AF|nr:sushi domain-containing protein 1-like isoform X2 [Echeneis naucrates]